MGVKVTGQFEPAGAFSIVDGKDVSGHITGSNISGSATGTGSFGKLLGDGSSLTGINSYSVSNTSGSRILTSVGATTGNAEANLTFDGSTLGVTGALTVSGNITANGNIVGDNSTIISGLSSVTATTIKDFTTVSGSSTSTGSFAKVELSDFKITTPDGVGYVTYNRTSNLMTLGTNGVDRVYILSNGKVGIGQSTNVLKKLDVVGGDYNSNMMLKGSSASAGIEFRDGSNNIDGYVRSDNGVVGLADTGGDFMVKAVNDNSIQFSITGTEISRITSTMAISGSATTTGSFGHLRGGVLTSEDGNIKYKAGTQTFQNAAGTKTMAVFNGANSVDLHYNNSKKFETTNTGVTVSGNLIATGDITAQRLIVSSSVTNMTIAEKSGSTIFGDSTDDTHLFTGSVNITGSATATSFIGDGSQLTGLTPAAITTYNNATNNRILTSVNSTTIQGESTLTFDGNQMDLSTTGHGTIHITGGTGRDANLKLQNNSRLWIWQNDGDNTLAKGAGTLHLYDGTAGATRIAVNSTGIVEVPGGVSGSLTSTGSFGKLLGDGSSLTGIASYTVANSANNRVLTSVDSTNGNAEANLTFDGTTLGVTGNIQATKIGLGHSNTSNSAAATILNKQLEFLQSSGNDGNTGIIFSEAALGDNSFTIQHNGAPSGRLNSLKFKVYGGTTAMELFRDKALVISGNITGSHYSGSLTSTGSFGRTEVSSGKVLGKSTSGVTTPFSIVGGTGTSAGGLKFGAYDANFGGIWPASVTPASSNYAFVARNGRTVINTTTDIGLYKDDATVLLFANSTGVAIGGSTTPAYKLDVGGTGRFTGDITAQGNIVGDNSTNISGVNNITTLGNISANGNISGSATTTGSFGEVMVASNLALGGDPISNVGTTGANLTITANNPYINLNDSNATSGTRVFSIGSDNNKLKFAKMTDDGGTKVEQFLMNGNGNFSMGAGAGNLVEHTNSTGGNLTLDGNNPALNLYDNNATSGQRNKAILSMGGALYIGKTADNGTSAVHHIVVDNSGNVEVPVGNISGSSTSTGSFGRIETAGDVVIDNGNISGSSTSTGSFGKLLGDASDLTNLPASFTVANSSDNRVITSVDSTNGNAEANLTFNGGSLVNASSGTQIKLNFTDASGTANGYNYFMAASNDSGNRAVHFVNGSNRSSDNGTNTYTIRNDGGSFHLGRVNQISTLEGSTIVLKTGNVGINETSPDTKLEVAGAHVSGKGLVHIDSTDHSFIALDAHSASHNKGIYFQENGVHQSILEHQGTENRLRIWDGSTTYVTIGDSTGDIHTIGNISGSLTSTGSFGRVETAGNLVPKVHNTSNLGSESKRWANIYSADLQLSNMDNEEGNEIDGTKGSWTIQEGEDDLYLLNRKNGKKYKFKLEEIT